MKNLKGKRVIVIDDSKKVREEIINALKSKDLFEYYDWAEDGLNGFKKVIAQDYDLILLDIMMPHLGGYEFLVWKGRRKELENVPVILITSKDDVKSKVKGLQLGANDYVVKPFEKEELLARVVVHLKLKKLQDELISTLKKVEKLSVTDPLTGLYNRRHLMEILQQEYERAVRYSTKFSIIMVDIDHFKDFNDRYGHLTGDMVLTKVAQELKRNLRKHDIIGRYGGEEFVIILPETDLKGAHTVAERYRKLISEKNFGSPNSPLHVTISLGVASYPENKMKDIDDMLRLADTAMYTAKRNGRNRVELAA